MDKQELEKLLEASYNEGKRDGLLIERERHAQEIELIRNLVEAQVEQARVQGDADATKRERDASVLAQTEARNYGISVGKADLEKAEQQAYERGHVAGVRQGREEIKAELVAS